MGQLHRMPEERVQRRLAAILAADVVGYSRLMEQDEAGTFTRLRAHRKELFKPEIEKHNGRIFKLMATAFWPSSAASSMRSSVLSSFKKAWRSATLASRRINACWSASA